MPADHIEVLGKPRFMHDFRVENRQNQIVGPVILAYGYIEDIGIP